MAQLQTILRKRAAVTGLILFAGFGPLPSCMESNAGKAAADHVPEEEIMLPAGKKYCWKENYDSRNALCNRIPAPEGYVRTDSASPFGQWLRFEPLKEGTPKVHLYNGELKSRQDVHVAVVDIDPGNRDLQQCADAVMRMRAEYLYSVKNYADLHFNFTSGDNIGFKKWSEGYRTKINGNKVSWVKSAAAADDYKTFRSYCNMIFNYAGTSSLSKELKRVASVEDIQPGDVFIVGGFPGHAVLVSDVCINKKTGKKLFLIQQSYMPAQEIHILKNPGRPDLSPWYEASFEGLLVTPEWSFTKQQLMRF